MIRKVEGKYITWKDSFRSDTKVAYEDTEYDYNELSSIKLIFKILFKKGFKWRLQNVIQYAYRHSDCYKGSGASDIMLLRDNDEYNNFWRG